MYTPPARPHQNSTFPSKPYATESKLTEPTTIFSLISIPRYIIMKTVGPSFPAESAISPSPTRQQNHQALTINHSPPKPLDGTIHREEHTARPPTCTSPTRTRNILRRSQLVLAPAQPPFPRWAATHQAICFCVSFNDQPKSKPNPAPASTNHITRWPHRNMSVCGGVQPIQTEKTNGWPRLEAASSPLTHRRPVSCIYLGRRDGPMETKQSS